MQRTFERNEWLETLLRMKQEQPRRYKSHVSDGLNSQVEEYARRKLFAEKKPALR